MDWRLWASTFVTIFLAELGDKTQLTALSLSASDGSRWAILIAASAALICSTALAVLLGEALTGLVPMVWIRRAAGVAFLVLGVTTLVQSR